MKLNVPPLLRWDETQWAPPEPSEAQAAGMLPGVPPQGLLFPQLFGLFCSRPFSQPHSTPESSTHRGTVAPWHLPCASRQASWRGTYLDVCHRKSRFALLPSSLHSLPPAGSGSPAQILTSFHNGNREGHNQYVYQQRRELSNWGEGHGKAH